MRSEVRIRFDGSALPGGAQTVLGPAACGPDVAMIEDVPVLRQIEVWVTLERSDPRVPILRALLTQYGCQWLENHQDRYTEEELDAARLLVMQSNGDCQVDGGIVWGMTYDLSEACSVCGTGGRQTSAVFFNGEQLPKLEGQRAGATYFWHHLVDEGLAAELERIGATGLSFRSVYAVMRDQRQVKLRWQQMCADKTLPPMSPRSSGFERDRACRACARNGYFTATDEAPTRFVYRAADLQGADDVNMSWENVGFAILKPDLRDSLLSKPWMLVTPKVRRVFRDAGVTAFDWTPIRLEDGDGDTSSRRG